MAEIEQSTATTYPGARFWDRMAARYSRSPIADEATYQEKLRITRSYLQPDMTMLEFGCGTGSTALVHAPHVARILATDISANMLEIAAAKARDAKIESVAFEHSSVEAFEAAEGSFDVVLCLSILHLLADRNAAVAKVHRLLKPGGLFVSSTACLGDWLSWFRFVAPLGRRLGLIPLVKVFTADDLARSITDAGFEIERRWEPGPKKAVFIVARKPD